MQFKQTTVFDNWEEVSKKFESGVKMYGAKEASLYRTPEGKIEISFVGKIPPAVVSLINFDAGETIADYEGIDDATKMTGYVIPADKAPKLLVDTLGYEGSFHEIKTGEVDPISGEVEMKVYYIQNQGLEESPNDLISEYIEAAISMVDNGDDVESVLQAMFESYNQILAVTGNANLQSEVNQKLLDVL